MNNNILYNNQTFVFFYNNIKYYYFKKMQILQKFKSAYNKGSYCQYKNYLKLINLINYHYNHQINNQNHY